MTQFSKMTFIATVLLSSIAFGGPEDRDKICYEATENVQFLPQSLCLDHIQIIQLEQNPKVEVYSYRSAQFLNNLGLSYLARHNEDGFSFEASSVLSFNCDQAKNLASKTELFVSGRSSNEGDISATGLYMEIRKTVLSKCSLNADKIEQITYKYKYAE